MECRKKKNCYTRLTSFSRSCSSARSNQIGRMLHATFDEFYAFWESILWNKIAYAVWTNFVKLRFVIRLDKKRENGYYFRTLHRKLYRLSASVGLASVYTTHQNYSIIWKTLTERKVLRGTPIRFFHNIFQSFPHIHNNVYVSFISIIPV